MVFKMATTMIQRVMARLVSPFGSFIGPSSWIAEFEDPEIEEVRTNL